MNTKTTKFLAVLAVLAMAFATFAVIAPVAEQDAATMEATDVSDKNAQTVSGGDSYYTDLTYSTGKTTFTVSATATGVAKIYILNTAAIAASQAATITFAAATTITSVNVYLATSSSTYTAGYELVLTPNGSSGNSIDLYVAAANDGFFTSVGASYAPSGTWYTSYPAVSTADTAVKYVSNDSAVTLTGSNLMTFGPKVIGEYTVKVADSAEARVSNLSTGAAGKVTFGVSTSDLLLNDSDGNQNVTPTKGSIVTDATPDIDSITLHGAANKAITTTGSAITMSVPSSALTTAITAATWIYGTVDASYQQAASPVEITFVNATGTYKFAPNATTAETNTIQLTGFKGTVAGAGFITLTADAANEGALKVTKGTFASASTAFAGIAVEAASLTLSGALTATGAISVSGSSSTVPGLITISGTNADITGAVVIGTYGKLNVTGATTDFTEKVQVKDKGTLDIDNTTTFAKDVEVRGTMEIADGKAVTITDAAFSLYGELTGADYADSLLKVKATAKKTASFKAYDGSFINELVQILKDDTSAADGTVTIDLSGATKTVYLSGVITSSTTYGQSQKVIINGDLEIVGGADVIVYGGFEIAEDSAIDFIITNGTFTVNSSAADVVLNGTITVAENGEFTITSAKSVVVNGTIYNYGDLTISTADASIANGGKIVDRAETGKSMSISKMTVAKGGVLQINGILTSATNPGVITNAGTVIFERAVLVQNMTVDMSAADASVEVKSYTNSATNVILKIVDDSMKSSTLTKKTSSSIEFQTTAATAGIGAAGVTITESATSISSGDDKGYYPLMTVSGSLSLFDIRETKSAGQTVKMTLSDSETTLANFEITDGFIVGPAAKFIVVDELTIKNTIYFTGSTTADAVFELSGAATEVIVQGVIIQNPYVINTTVDTKIHAVKFTTGTTEVYTYYASVESAVKVLEEYTDDVVLTLLGSKLSILESITIPANITINGTAKTLTIGSDDDTDVAVYMKSGAKINSGVSLVVKGSIYAEVAQDIKSTSIQADVKGSDGTDVLYTNVYSALDVAEAGDVVETIQDITILKSITVKDGVQLYVPSGYDMYVNPANKVIITVDGILRANEGMTLTTGSWGTTVSATVAVLDVEGAFLTGESDTPATVYTNYNKSVSGVYYNVSNDLGNYVYITDMADALSTTCKTFYVYGKVSEAMPVVAKPSSGSIAINVMEGAEFKVANLTLEKATVTATGTISGVINGQLGDDAYGTVTLSKYVGEVKDSYNSTDKIYTFGINAIAGDVEITAGTVKATGDITAVASSEFTVAEDAAFVIPNDYSVTLGQDYAIVGDVYAYGVLTLAKKDAVILGDIEVVNDTDNTTKGTLNVTQQTYLLGNILIDEDTACNVNANLIVGLEPTDLGAAGVIAGDLDLADNAAIIVYPTADVSMMVIDPDAEGVSTAKVTLFYINEELYMAVYVSSSTTVLVKDVIAIPEFDLEDYETGTLNTTKAWNVTDTTKVGAYIALEATIVLKQIDITASFAKGLSLYVDGVRVPMSGAEVSLAVGIHLVEATIEPGYACDNMAITFNGVPVTSAGILITVDDEDSVLAATGDVYIPEPEPVTPEEKSEWTITTILLVVLVILIAIMAVIVALRLNRS